MRLLSLVVKGFGPYVNLELLEDDLRTLNDSKVFLISGEIGAGKTTIFDAILYALYGETTLEGRTASDLVSHFLKESKPAEVNLKFALDGKVYRISRKISPKTGGKDYSALWIEDKLFSTKKNEIKEKIKSLFGLDAKQFKKVFLIPQGEYRKILLAKKEERLQLFQNIFDTELFYEFEAFLKEKVKSLKSELNTLFEREKELKTLAKVETLSELKLRLKKLKTQEETLIEEIKKLQNTAEVLEEKLINQRKALELKRQLHELKQKLKDLEGKKEEITRLEAEVKKLKTIKDYIPSYHQLRNWWKELRASTILRKELREKVKNLKTEVERKRNTLKKLLEKEELIEVKKRELTLLKEAEEFFKKREFLINEKLKLEKLVKDLKNEQTYLEQKQVDLKNKLEKTREKLQEIAKAKLVLKEIEVLEKRCEAYKSWQNWCAKEKEVFAKIKEVKAKIRELEKKKEELELKCHAEFLIKHLKKGEPCPVCGSTEHPKPFKGSGEFTSLEKVKTQIKQLEEVLKREEETYYKILGKKEGLEKEIEELKGETPEKILKEKILEAGKWFKKRREITKIEKDLEEEIRLTKALLEKVEKELKTKSLEREKAEREFAKTSSQLELVENHLNRFEVFKDADITKKIVLISQEIDFWNKEKSKLEEEIKRLETLVTQKVTELNKTEELIQFALKNYKECLKSVCELKKKKLIKDLKELKVLESKIGGIEAREEELNNYYLEMEKCRAEIQKLEAELEKVVTEVGEKEVEKELKRVKEALSRKNRELGGVKELYSQLSAVCESFSEVIKKKKELEELYGKTQWLYDFLSGKNRLGVSFHSFVISIFGKFVFERASQYLKEFSFGRYEFVKDKLFEKSFSIDVFDAYTGKVRDVKTLSGGESFIATLSLALGISDVILYMFRTKPLESLFIDEGFGSLDEATLEKVMEILLGLAYKSGRTIGLISHLKELKDRFPVVLEVYKDPLKGSYVKIRKRV
ncbi:MAG: AAA family ATPase [Thermodesulfobacteria bacterium]|nr:AAA family ATPase [Thermodesulfobacteriota bacterium]